MDAVQLELFATNPISISAPEPQIDINSYDYYLVAFSGGKDSLASLLNLLDLGISPNKIELWHHCVDGKPGNNFMDWLPTLSYVKKVANFLNIPLYFSWRNGGFKKELFRNNEPTAAMTIETPSGIIKTGGKGKNGTRRKFPQQSGNLQVRWCSSYLKIGD